MRTTRQPPCLVQGTPQTSEEPLEHCVGYLHERKPFVLRMVRRKRAYGNVSIALVCSEPLTEVCLHPPSAYINILQNTMQTPAMSTSILSLRSAVKELSSTVSSLHFPSHHPSHLPQRRRRQSGSSTSIDELVILPRPSSQISPPVSSPSPFLLNTGPLSLSRRPHQVSHNIIVNSNCKPRTHDHQQNPIECIRNGKIRR